MDNQDEDPKCVRCFAPATSRCGKCKQVWYCSRACQIKHWKLGHKAQCKKLRNQQSSKKKDNEVVQEEKKEQVIPDPPNPAVYLHNPDDVLELVSKANVTNLARNQGLVNRANTCYLNSVVQCLTHTPPLHSYLEHELDPERHNAEQDYCCMLCALQRHIWDVVHAEEAILPVNILSQLQQINENFALGQQEDAHEFFRAFIRAVQEESLISYQDYKIDEPTSQTTFISQLFRGLFQNKLTCPKCNSVFVNYEAFMDLSLEVSDATDSLREALESFTAPELLDGTNMYRCPNCDVNVRAEKRLSIYRPPNILVIHLKRFRLGFQGKVNKKIPFTVDLGLRPFMDEAAAENDKALYKLYAIVVHLDMFNISFFGHYVCYVRGEKNRWWKYDDNRVESVSQSTVLKQNAYLLFYHRVGDIPPPLPAVSSLEEIKRDPNEVEMEEKFDVRVELAADEPVNCVNGCGFYGSPATQNYCSKCFGEVFPEEAAILKQQNEENLKKIQEESRDNAQARMIERRENQARQQKLMREEALARQKQPQKKSKVKRNAPCPCGSGLKYKKCHGAQQG